ncbi:MAG: NADH-quinone oxidoreductase subunit L [Planctomycetota bacterium]
MPNWYGYDPTIWLLTGATFAPLLGFVILLFLGKRMGRASGWFGTAVIACSAVLALTAAAKWVGMDQATPPTDLIIPWLSVTPTLVLSIGAHVDSLTIAMFSMVTVVATMIHLFSIGYMAGDSRFSRFFAYLNLFCFSMLGLVLGNTLLSLFIFWELVGLCSYLLIGFWFEKKSASTAAIKAFVVNRIGDFGFILGLAGAFLWLGPEWAKMHPGATMNLTIAQMAEAGQNLIAAPGGAPLWLTAVGLLLFCGAMGKSAQFPLHVWLPDAMEGPTPVSALIHAATMVAAGVYMVARVFGLLTPDALLVIACIGLITLTMGALIAITQTDIKRVLAYSTVSQLGYMVLAIGLGGYIAGLFHLITHAFFKALMFLGSGSVIHACHHEQDIRKMGGLWKAIPVTCVTFLVGVLAIAGVSYTSGYYSKHLILANAYDFTQGRASTDHDAGHSEAAQEEPAHGQAKHEATHSPTPLSAAAQASAILTSGAGKPFAKLFYYLPMAMAYVTSFYMFRLWWLTFFTAPRDKHVHHHAEHGHMPWVMNTALIVLAAGAVLSGYNFMYFAGWIEATWPTRAWAGLHPVGEAAHAIHLPAMLAAVVGFALAFGIYRKGFGVAAAIRRPIEPIYQLVHNKFYVDELYNATFVKGTLALCRLSNLWDKWIFDGLVNLIGYLTKIAAFVSGWFDNRGIDGAANGLAAVTLYAGNIARTPQTGRVRNYVLYMVTGFVLAVGILLLVRMFGNA